MVTKIRNKQVVTIGGGTGNFTLLTGLRNYPLDLSVIVSMADNGGSTGLLRDELGVLPPGDIRQCLVALSSSDKTMRTLMNYRFSGGKLSGHNFGNLFLSALEKTTGSFDRAIDEAAKILRINGRVIPVTLDNIQLVAYLRNGQIVRGEHTIEYKNLSNLKKIALEPKAKANPKAIEAIKNADMIIIAPGDLYQSIIPNLLVSGIVSAIQESKAKKIYVCNLMTKPKHTDGYSVKDFSNHIELYLKSKLDFIIYNNKLPSNKLITRYAEEGERPVSIDQGLDKRRFIGKDLISRKIAQPTKGDLIQRNLIRHNPQKIAETIVSLL